MTGTALTEEEEFREIYGMDVVVIPTNRPVQRIDQPDSLFKTKKEKLNAIVEQINESYRKGQPVLVGTINIDASEELSRMLTKKHVPHKVLNAKFHELEAEIVADAGQKNAVTIATNMAGRGTDIKLGEGVAELGGLRIIGTERHESRRIDNQLRGRSGRQGDPGESKFYLSLEDDLMRLFGSERVMGIYEALKIPEGEEIEHSTMSNFVEKAQKKIEGNNFGIRKNLLEYDRINNEQREIIYKERRRVLDGENMREVIVGMIKKCVESCVDQVCSGEVAPEEWNIVELDDALRMIIPFDYPVELTEQEKKKGDIDAIKNRLCEEALTLYEKKEAQFDNPEDMREVERVILLKSIDRKWTDHIDDMDNLRQGIGLSSLGQRDPVVEYKFAGYDMFNEMTDAIREETVKNLYRIKIEQKIEREQVNKVTGTNKDDTVSKGPVRKAKKIGRNDPCPCGSGKKYKQCCGREA
jgi:preprotein translocase subunit SecA